MTLGPLCQRVNATRTSLLDMERLVEEDVQTTESHNKPVVVLVLVLAVLAVPGNVLVIVIWTSSRRLWAYSTSHDITAVAVCDLLACILCLPTDFSELYFGVRMTDPVQCKLYKFLLLLANLSSMRGLVCIALDRYLKRDDVNNVYSKLARKHQRQILGAGFAIALVLASPTLFIYGIRTLTPKTVSERMCAVSDGYRGSRLATAVHGVVLSFYLMAFLSLCVLYGASISSLWERYKQQVHYIHHHHVWPEHAATAGSPNTIPDITATPQITCLEVAGNNNACTDVTGNQNTCTDVTGNQNTCTDVTGNNSTCTDVTGNNNTCTDVTGNNNTCTDVTGNNNVCFDVAGNSSGQSRTADSGGVQVQMADSGGVQVQMADTNNNSDVYVKADPAVQDNDETAASQAGGSVLQSTLQVPVVVVTGVTGVDRQLSLSREYSREHSREQSFEQSFSGLPLGLRMGETAGNLWQTTIMATCTMITATVLFLLSYCPYLVLMLMDARDETFLVRMRCSDTYYTGYQLLSRSYLLSFVLNVLLYSLASPLFHREGMKVLRKRLETCLQDEAEASTSSASSDS